MRHDPVLTSASGVAVLGMALFSEREDPVGRTRNAVAAAAIQDLTRERAEEKAVRALLKQAEQRGGMAVSELIQEPFYRLSLEERLCLAAVVRAGWEYSRVARVLEITEDDVARILWSARLSLMTGPGGSGFTHPSGSSIRGARCPEYRAESPWTQRFLDEELSRRESIFLQNHLMACDRCRHALQSARLLVFEVEKRLPERLFGQVEALDQDLERVREQGQGLRRPLGLSFLGSVAPLLERRGVRVALLGLAALLVLKVWLN